jgi:hypothetical protein
VTFDLKSGSQNLYFGNAWLIKLYVNETYNKVHIDKHLSCNFRIQNGLKFVDDLWPLFFNSVLEYAVIKGQESRVGLKLNGAY